MTAAAASGRPVCKRPIIGTSGSRQERMAGQQLLRRQDVGMDPSDLERIAIERSDRWATAGFIWAYEAGPQTDNPAAWLRLRTPNADAFVKVWTSGDAEMDWGASGSARSRHYDLGSVEDLRACVDDLEVTLTTDI